MVKRERVELSVTVVWTHLKQELNLIAAGTPQNISTPSSRDSVLS